MSGFNFTGGALPSGATLTRSSHGTRCNISGALVEENNDVARFEYNPVSHTALGLLYEPSRRNEVQDSQNLTASSWTASNSTLTATTLVENTANAIHRVQPTTNSWPFTNGVPLTVSCIASELPGNLSKRYLMLQGAISFVTQAIFDLATGTVTYTSLCTATIVPAPGGGWLCSMTATPTATNTTGQCRFFVTNVSTGTAVAYTGDGVSGFNLSEIQYETGNIATSRIRTSGAGATWAADALTLSWGGQGYGDSTQTVRYTFSDGSTQDVSTVISSGNAAVPTTLNKPIIARADLLGSIGTSAGSIAGPTLAATASVKLQADSAGAIATPTLSANGFRRTTGDTAGGIAGPSLIAASSLHITSSVSVLNFGSIPWTPRDCLGLLLWWNADNAPAVVDTWFDEILGFPLVQPNAAQRPTRALAFGPNDKAAVYFDGVDDWLEGTGVGPLPYGSDPGTIMTVIDQQATTIPSETSRVRIFFGYGDGTVFHGTRAVRWLLQHDLNRRFDWHDSNSDLVDTVTDFLGYFILSMKMEAATGYGWMNGIPTTPPSAPMSFNTAPTIIRMGGRMQPLPPGVPTEYFPQGAIRHVFAGNWSDADRLRLEGWSAWESGLQPNLASDHPYKNAPPMRADSFLELRSIGKISLVASAGGTIPITASTSGSFVLQADGVGVIPVGLTSNSSVRIAANIQIQIGDISSFSSGSLLIHAESAITIPNVTTSSTLQRRTNADLSSVLSGLNLTSDVNLVIQAALAVTVAGISVVSVGKIRGRPFTQVILLS